MKPAHIKRVIRLWVCIMSILTLMVCPVHADDHIRLQNQTDEGEDLPDLPTPVDTSRRIKMPDFEFETFSGDILTRDEYGTGKDMLIVYGRKGCLNTRSFLDGIASYIDYLKQNEITVLVVLYDYQEFSDLQDMEGYYPGIVCATPTSRDGSSMWKALTAFGYDTSGSVSFPIIFLKNPQNRMTYYSVGYVSMPLRVVAGALKMKEDVHTIHSWDDGTVTKEATCTEPGVLTHACNECDETWTEEIPALGHSYKENIIEPTCIEEGYTNHICERCGDSYKDQYTEKVDHIYTETILPATCTAEGCSLHICKWCGDYYTDQYTEKLICNDICQGAT